MFDKYDLEVIENLREDVKNCARKIDQLANLVKEHNNLLKTLLRQAQMQQLLPDPPVLDGSEVPSLYEEWKAKMHAKLSSFDNFDAATKMSYIASRTTGYAYHIINLGKFEEQGQAFQSPTEVIAAFDSFFHNVERINGKYKTRFE